MEAQIGEQLSAGFVLTALHEDHWPDDAPPFNRFSPVAVATRAVKAAPDWGAAARAGLGEG